MLPSCAVSEDHREQGPSKPSAPAGDRPRILARPVAERRVIVLAPAQGAAGAESKVDWRVLAGAGLVPLLAPALGPAMAGAAVLARALDKDGTVTGAITRRVARELSKVLPSKSAKSALERITAAGALVVSTDAAERELVFPPGHPRVDHAYAAHPLSTEQYLPLAGFHQSLFEQKVSELVTLLAALGATSVRVRAARGYREAAGFSLGASVPFEGVRAEDGGSRVKSTAHSVVMEETFTPTREPSIPEGLLWLAHEPSWQALARRRMEFGASTFRIELQYDEDFGVDGGLVAALEGVGIRAGGSFRAFERTRWELEGVFAPNNTVTAAVVDASVLEERTGDPKDPNDPRGASSP
jgi:hypothetical protein